MCLNFNGETRMFYLDLFSGAGGGSLAIHNVFKDAQCLGFSEIDKAAISVYQSHFPDHVNLGDVSTIDFKQFRGKVDILIGGSPCQSFSIAQKNRKGFDGKSGLFFHYLRCIEEAQPKHFILENVASMKDEWRDQISNYLGCEPILINSSLVTAQSRKRYYWCNWKTSQPQDRGIILKDILENNVDPKYKLSIKAIEYMNRPVKDGRTHWDFAHHHDSNEDKSKCLIANLYKGVPYNVLIDRKKKNIDYVFFKKDKEINPKTTNQVGGVQNIEFIKYKDSFPQALRVYDEGGKSVTLSSMSGGLGAKTGFYNIDEDIVRKLTPIECERLQGYPDGWCSKTVSDNQAYKIMGNSFTVTVIEHLLSCLRDNPEPEEKMNYLF